MKKLNKIAGNAMMLQEDKNKFMCGNDTYGKCFRSMHIANSKGFNSDKKANDSILKGLTKFNPPIYTELSLLAPLRKTGKTGL
jgi:hypothetical protein